MREEINKIMHLAAGLASIGFAVLCVLAAFVAAVTAMSALFIVTAVGLLVYGTSSYIWAFTSLLRDRVVVQPPLFWMRAGLAIVLIALIGLVLV